jgi:hypothetical protein
MSIIRSSYDNVNGKRMETGRVTIKLDTRSYWREAHNIHEGIRKDKKLKFTRKVK